MSLALVVLLSAAAATPFPELARQAAAAREANRPQEAATLYRRALRQKPDWTEGWWYLGTILYDRNSYAEAADALSHFVKLEPKAAPGWAILGLCEFETGRYADSLAHVERGITLGLANDNPLAKVARYHSALLLTRSGQFERALVRFSELSTLGANDQDTVVAAGLAGLRIPILPAELRPARRPLVEQVGRAVMAAGGRQAAAAKPLFEQLVAAYPNEPQLHNLYGSYLLGMDPDAALREWQRELEISPGHVPARLQIAFEYLKRGEAPKAVPYAEEAVRIEPESFAAHNALGRALTESGERARGLVELEKARDLAPDSPEARVALASAYAAAGRPQDAARERAEFVRLRNLRDSRQ